jgi:cardiolipin synthase
MSDPQPRKLIEGEPAPLVAETTPAHSVVASSTRLVTPVQPGGALEGPRPSFSRAVWRIAAAEVSAGNTVQLLRDGPRTFELMLKLIDQAKESIDFEGYIFHEDEVGVRFAEAFRNAAQRGVKVRMLVDWVGRWPTRKGFFAEIRETGVDVRLFNPPGLRAWFGLLPRDHRKLLVVDGRAGVTGGLGIGKEWGHRFGRRKRKRLGPWRDTAVCIEGPAAVDMKESFERWWARAFGRTPEWRR